MILSVSSDLLQKNQYRTPGSPNQEKSTINKYYLNLW